MNSIGKSFSVTDRRTAGSRVPFIITPSRPEVDRAGRTTPDLSSGPPFDATFPAQRPIRAWTLAKVSKLRSSPNRANRSWAATAASSRGSAISSVWVPSQQ